GACSISMDRRCAPSTLVVMRSSSTRGSHRLPHRQLCLSEAGVKAAECRGGTTRTKRRGGTTRAALTPRPSEGYRAVSASLRSSTLSPALALAPIAWQGLRRWSEFPEFRSQNFRNPHAVLRVALVTLGLTLLKGLGGGLG